MNVLLKGAEVYTEEGLKRCDLSICIVFKHRSYESTFTDASHFDCHLFGISFE